MRRSLKVLLLFGMCITTTAFEPAPSAKPQDRSDVAQRSDSAPAQVERKGKNGSRNEPWSFVAWPIVIYAPQGVLFYATQGATNVGISPYQNNLAIGHETLNPTTHKSPSCNSSAGFKGFCGDEVAYGDNTLQFDVTGRDNTAIGDHALANNVSGKGNTAVGSSAAANITASDTVEAFGVSACQNARNYTGPVQCIGQAALENAGSASQYTTALGFQAGLYTTDAEFSVMLGSAAGYSAATNTYSTLVGEGACHGVTSITGSICIGTINGPAGGSMANMLWIGGNNGAKPIFYGNLSNNAVVIGGTTPGVGAGLTVNGGGIVGPFVRTTPVTVAGLSTADPSPQVGDRALVTDARSCAFGVAVGGGGSISCPVYYNGTSWFAG